MSQNAIVLPTTGTFSGLTEQGYINNALDTINTKFSGATAPSSPEVGQYWLNNNVTTAQALEIYDGANWQVIGVMDTTNSIWTPPVGGGKIPTIASAATVNLGATPQARKYLSGTTTITSFGTAGVQGQLYFLKSLGALQITAGSNIITISGTNMAVNANDEMIWSNEGSNVYKLIYWSAGNALPSIASNTILANVTGSSAAPVGQTMSTLLDILGATNGTVPYRSGGTWSNQTVSAILDAALGAAVGGVAVRGTSAWGAVSPVSAGYVLTDNGPGAVPSMQASAASSNGGATTNTITSNLILTNSSNRYQSVVTATDDILVMMPNATTMPTLGSPCYLITNDGTISFGITDYYGNLIVMLQPGESCFISLLANSTISGTWSFQVCKSLVGLLTEQFFQQTPMTVDSTITPSTYIQSGGIVAMSSNTFLMTFVNNPAQSSGVTTYAMMFTYAASTKTITPGTPVSISTTAYINYYNVPQCVYLTSTTALIIYSSNSAVYGQVVTISGSTVTAGTQTTISTTAPIAQIPYIFSMTAGTQYFMAWSNGTIRYCVISISGTTVTAGSTVNGQTPTYWSGSQTSDPYGGFTVYQISSNLYVTATASAQAANTTYIYLQMQSVSGTTVTNGTLNNAASNFNAVSTAYNQQPGLQYCAVFVYLSGYISLLFLNGSTFQFLCISYSGTTISTTNYGYAAYPQTVGLSLGSPSFLRNSVYFKNSTTVIFNSLSTKTTIFLSGSSLSTLGMFAKSRSQGSPQSQLSSFLLSQSAAYTSGNLTNLYLLPLTTSQSHPGIVEARVIL